MRTPLNRMEIRSASGDRKWGVPKNKHVSEFVGAYGENVRGATKKNPKGIHQGWDLYAASCTPVYAITNGIIVRTHLNHPDYGGLIVMEFEFDRRRLYALYAHLNAILAHETQTVREGEVIAITGTTGNAKGGPPHLHFAIMTTPDLHKGLTTFKSPGDVIGYHYRGLFADDHLGLEFGRA